MRVPLGNAEWNAGVELLFGSIFGCRVHYPDEFIAVTLLFVKQGSRMIRIEVGTRFEAVPVICEVVLLLRPVGHKNFEAIGQGNFVVRVFLRSLAGCCDHGVGFFLIARL